MNDRLHTCCICTAEADWVRTRMPNTEQMFYLCERHYRSLQERNAVLAGYYDAIASLSPMERAAFERLDNGGDADRLERAAESAGHQQR